MSVSKFDIIFDLFTPDFKKIVSDIDLLQCKTEIYLILSQYKTSRNVDIAYSKLHHLIDHWCGNPDAFVEVTCNNTKAFFDSLVKEEPPISILLNSMWGGFNIKQEVIDEYNRKNNSSLSPFDFECRFIPEFIDKVKQKFDINGLGCKLFVTQIPADIFKINAWTIETHDGAEDLIIRYDLIKEQKTNKFLNILKKIIYNDTFCPIENKLKFIRFLVPENNDLDELIENGVLFE